MTQIEESCRGKESDTLNEDGIVFTPCYAAVVDGSTSKGNGRLNGEKSGRVAMKAVSDALRALPGHLSMEQAAARLTQAIRTLYERHGLTEHVSRFPHDRFTCSAVVYSNMRREVWFFGDCQCRFDGTTYTNNKRVDGILTDIRCDILCYLLAKGHTVDELRRNDLGRRFILSSLRDQCAFQNAAEVGEFAYPVIDGFPLLTGKVRVLAVPEHVQELILASDGYPLLFDTLRETERYLFAALSDDPLCCHALRMTKAWLPQNESFDDRTYLRFRI